MEEFNIQESFTRKHPESVHQSIANKNYSNCSSSSSGSNCSNVEWDSEAAAPLSVFHTLKESTIIQGESVAHTVNNRPTPKLKCKISSDLAELNRLHNSKYPWIPSEDQIRPTEEVRQKKKETLDSIIQNWAEFTDYIYHTVFDKKLEMLNGKFTVTDRNTFSDIRFLPNEFPYRVAGHHYVLWFGARFQVNSYLQLL
jgi:hypothetical protein